MSGKVIASLKSLFNYSQEDKPRYEICIKSHTDKNARIQINCCHSIPHFVPVICWHVLVIEKETPPSDIPFVQLVNAKRNTLIEDVVAEYGRKNLKALIIIGSVSLIQDLKTFTSPSIPVLVVLSSDIADIKELVNSHSSRQLLFSCVPLSSSEMKQRSDDYSIINDSEKYYGQLISKVCDSVKENVIMSIAVNEDRRDLRLIQTIISSRISIEQQGTMEMMYSLNNSDHELLMKILMNREDFRHYFCKDFPVYVILGEWLYSTSTMHRINCNESYVTELFDAFTSADILEIAKGLNDFVELPDVGVMWVPIYGDVSSIQAYVADNLLVLLKEFLRLNGLSKQNGILETFIAISIAIRLFVSSGQMKKTNNIWNENFVDPLVELCDSSLPYLLSGIKDMNVILETQPQLMFGWKELFQILSSKIYPLSFIQSSLVLLSEHLIKHNTEHPFIMFFLTPLINHFKVYLKRYGPIKFVCHLNMTHTKAVYEGFDFINFLTLLSEHHSWDFGEFHCVVFDLLDILTDLLNLEQHDSVVCLEKLSARKEVWYIGYFLNQIVVCFKAIASKLSICHFVELFNAGQFDNQEIIQEYLMECPIPSSLLESGVILFLELCSKRLTLNSQKQLSSYLKRICQKYSSQREFFIDLVHLKPNDTPSIINEVLEEIVEHHLSRSGDCLRGDLPSIISQVLEYLLFKYSMYHERYINFLVTKFLQQCTNYGSNYYNCLLTSICQILQDEDCAHSLRTSVSLQLLNMIADLVSIDTESILWLSESGKALVHLANGYVLSKKLQVTIALCSLEEKMTCLCKALKSVNNSVDTRSIIYDNLKTFEAHFADFHSIWQLLLDKKCIELDVVRELIDLYDACVKDITKLLIRPFVNETSILYVQTRAVLQSHGIVLPEATRLQIDERLILTTDGSKYRSKRDVILCDLQQLQTNISDFVSIVESSLEILVFIGQCKGMFFTMPLEYFKAQCRYFTVNADSCNEQSADEKNFIILNHIVELSEKSLFKLVHGESTFSEVESIYSFDSLKDKAKLDSELRVLKEYFVRKLKLGAHDNIVAKAKEGLKALVVLFNIKKDMETLFGTCETYSLKACLNDDRMKELQQIVDCLSSKESYGKITLNDGILKLNLIKKNLSISDFENVIVFELISVVQHCPHLYNFCVSRGFASVEGYQRFIAEHKLVMIVMEKEDYFEDVLNQLRGAMVFISPFFNQSNNLFQLMTQLLDLTANIPVGILQLQRVELEIEKIETSFNLIEGETPEFVLTILKAMLENGEFLFSSGPAHEIILSLKFYQNPSKKHLLSWNLEKLEDFMRKVMFFNAEKKGNVEPDDNNEGLIWFKQCYQNAKLLMERYDDLQKMGHTDYTRIGDLEKRFSLRDDGRARLDSELDRSKIALRALVSTINEARSEFKELSFISLPKMKLISEKVVTRNYDLAGCIDDIGMHLILTLDTKVKGNLEKNIALFYSNNEHHTDLSHAHLTGVYLQYILSNIPAVHHLQSLTAGERQQALQQSSLFRMYTAIKFTNMELIRLIFWIFGNEFPYPFQLFRCSSSTTKDDLELLFQRINKYSDFKYLIFGVNQLLMEVQQALISHCSSLRSAVLKGDLHGYHMPDVCLVELVASVFQNMPWLAIVKVDKSRITPKKNIKEYCKTKILSRFKSFRVITGMPGSGKTQFIHKQLKSSFHDETMSISINEAFTKEKCIRELKKLSHNEFNAAVYLNISLFCHKSLKQESQTFFEDLAEEINWFFFDYLILGYAEDLKTGLSLRFPDCVSRSLYVEVPFWDISEDEFEISNDKKLQASYKEFCDVFPVFCLMAEKEQPNMNNIVNDPELSLVFKYLRNYEDGNLDKTISIWDKNPIKIETDPPVSAVYCQTLLIKYVPEDLRSRTIKENLFLRYLARRCRFMEECPQLMFNSGYKRSDGLDTTNMRSILLNIMLKEVKRFCQQTMQWNDATSQLIYNFTDGGTSFRFISCDPTKLSQQEAIQRKPIKEREITMTELKAIGVKLPNAFEMNSPKLLHEYLSTALSISLDLNHELEALKKAGYILTKDFTLKMLNIHERKECGMPVIIEGDTGVGKTFLIEMLSILWNESWNQHIVRQKQCLKETVIKIVMEVGQKNECVKKFLSRFNFNESIPINDWTEVLSIKYGQKEKYSVYKTLRQYIEFCWNDPILAYLEIPKELHHLTDLGNIIQSYEKEQTAKLLASVIVGILSGKPRNCFYKLNIHAATTTEEIVSVFIEVEEHAQAMTAMFKDYQDHGQSLKAFQRPIISVFLDEINTSSCPGFLKEIIIDRTMNGVPISDNIFIVAACNPYRGVSQISACDTEGGWLRPAYYVQPLAPTLELIKWKYGSLRDVDEAEYIREKMELLYSNATGLNVLAPKENAELQFLSGLIQKGQMLIRKYATEQLLTCSKKMNEEEAERFSKSCVSQRDMQRVFIIYEWLLKWFKASNHYSTEPEFNHRVRATYVAIGVAYYFRLNVKYRQCFEEEMNLIKTIGEQNIPIRFSVALQQELDLMLKKFKLPSRISATLALKENVYATVVCLLNRIPLIIVGPPGSSKTLTIKIICSNLKGINSEVDAFKNETLFPPVEMHSYQCTRRSTSSEIELVFQRAINRKKMLDEVGLKHCSFIVMDEAGLTEESHESLKVLHYYLDRNEVSFVGLSNHMLDAAKTNRAICLYHTNSSLEDLRCIARTMFSAAPTHSEQSLSVERQPLVAFIDHFLDVYMNKMKEFKQFYGVRDFVHFLLYLYRNKEPDAAISPKVVVEALERNFNGKKDVLEILIPKILTKMDVDPSTVAQRTSLDVFKSSLQDQPSGFSIESQVRYKLVIDENEDDSLVEILLTFGILDRVSTSILVCTKFPGDTESVKTNTIAAVRYCAAHGKTAVLINCEDIEESFYDLFNQNFSCINRGEGNTRLYANIAVGAQTKLCFVDPKFQCVVIVKKEQIHHTPSPYLNRFEKYWFTPKSILTEYVQSFPKRFINCVTEVVEKVNKVFGNCRQYLYSFTEDTVSSLMLSFLKPICQYSNSFQEKLTFTEADSVLMAIIKALINSAIELTPLNFLQTIDNKTLNDDVRYINKLINESGKHIPILKKSELKYASSIAEKSLKWLMEETGDSSNSIIDDQTALGMFCFEQWLEISLGKKLMCLMTPEALIALDCNLPLYYKEFYLKNQFHFSLAGFMNHIRQMGSNEECSTSTAESAKTLPSIRKAICYTRSTHLIHELLPLHYNYWKDNLSEKEKENLKAFFNVEIELINIYSLNTTTTSQDVQSVLKHFFSDEKHEVLLFIADMKRTSSEVINHTRIMISEFESQSHCQPIDKLIVLLLHFPSDLRSNKSYPAIFLHNWDHYYFDNIGARDITGRGNIDIVSWLKQCCLNELDPFVTSETLCHWLGEILPALSAHINIKDVTELSRSVDIWKKVLFETILADELIGRFLSYWKPTTMIDVSRKALMASKTSSLGLMSIIESEFYQSFTDFMLYSLSLVNKHGAVRLLSSNEVEIKTHNLFLRLLPSVPLPSKMEDFKAVYTILHLKRHKLHSKGYSFPFFKLIFRLIEHTLNVTINEFYDGVNMNLEDTIDQEPAVSEVKSAFEQPRMMSGIVNLMKTSLQTQVQNVVYLREALDAMKEDTVLLKTYIQDAVSKQMNKRGTVGTNLLHDYFTKMISDSHDTESQLCAFHVNLRFHVKTSTIWSALSIVHCIDDLLDAKLCEETLLLESFHYQSLQNVTMFFSDLIEVIYSVIRNILNSDDYGKMSSISSIFYKTVAVASHADLKQIPSNVMNHLILIYVCMELRHAFVTCNEKEEFVTSFEDFALNFLELLSNEADKERILNLKSVIESLMSQAYDVKNMDATLSFPASAVYMVDSILNLYVIQSKMLFLQYEDFDWLLKLIHICRDGAMHHVLVYYSKLILLTRESGYDCEIQATLNFNNNYRKRIGTFLTNQSAASVYIPKFYRNCPNVVVNQPSAIKKSQSVLGDSYFQIVVEQLSQYIGSSHPADIISIINTDVETSMDPSVDDGEKHLITIEKEALVYVLIMHLARILKNGQDDAMAEIGGVIKSINIALNCEHLKVRACNDIEGHGILFALRLFQAFNSSRKFGHMMTNNFELFFQPFECLLSVPKHIRLPRPTSSLEELPIMSCIREYHKDLCQQIQLGIEKILKLKADEGVSQILRVGSKCYIDGANLEEEKKLKWTFNMILLLVVYNQCYRKKNWSGLLALKIHKDFQYIEKDFRNLIIFFANPDYFRKNCGEVTNSYEDLERILLNELATELPLMDILIQSLAVVVGFPKKNSHFWTHLCCPGDMQGSVIFPTLPWKIHPDKHQFYPNVRDLLTFKHLEYIERNSLNFQSLSLILFINYGVMLFSSLVNPAVCASSHEAIIPSGMSISEFCSRSLKSLWENDLSTVLNVSDDDKEFLIIKFLIQFYKSSKNGNFIEKDVISYEKELHSVFVEAWKTMKNVERSRYLNKKMDVTFRSLESGVLPVFYSHERTKSLFLKTILSSTDFGNTKSKLYVLYQFILWKNSMNAGGKLLPYLIYCYHFITDKWSHMLSKEMARKESMKELLNDYLKENLPDSTDDVMHQFDLMTTHYNTYSNVTGADPLPSNVWDYLSFENKDGVLLEAIYRIVNKYNDFLKGVMMFGSCLPSLSFLKHHSYSLPVSVIDATTCCFGDSTSFDDCQDFYVLIEKHCDFTVCPPKGIDPTFLPLYSAECFDFEKIQLGIVKKFIMHKQLISLDGIKKEFRFLNNISQELEFTKYNTSLLNMDYMQQSLQNHSNYLVTLPRENVLEFKSLFLPLHYHAMLKVLIGLAVLVKCLSQVLADQRSDESIQVLCVTKFIAIHLSNGRSRDDQTGLETVGIHKQTAMYYYSGINKEQYVYLSGLNMRYVFDIVKRLSIWIQSGVYDFYSLPTSMKTELDEAVCDEIQSKLEQSEDVQSVVQALVDMLISCESAVKKEIYKNTQSPLYEVIKCDWIRKNPLALSALHKSVQVQHYVYFLILLRSILVKCSPKDLPVEHTESGESANKSLVCMVEDIPDLPPPTLAVKPSVETIPVQAAPSDQVKMKEAAEKLSMTDLLDFLKSIGMAENVVEFVGGYNISAEVLFLAMNEDNQLIQIGMERPYLRLKFRVLFRRFLLQQTSTCTVDMITNLCRQNSMLAKFSEVFERHQIDGEMFSLANDQELKDLGICGLERTILRVNFRNGFGGDNL